MLAWLMPRQNFISIALGVYAPHETGDRSVACHKRVGKGCGGKGLLACVVVVYNLCLIIRCIEETGVALPGHLVG